MEIYKEPVIETERLILRPIVITDLDDVFEWNSDPKVNEFMSYCLVSDKIETKKYIESLVNNEKLWTWGVIEKNSGEMIGSIGIGVNKFKSDYFGFAYNFKQKSWGKGYASETVTTIVKYMIHERGIKKFIAYHDISNPASGRVIEKAGLKYAYDGEYYKLDGSKTFQAKFYTLELD